LHLQKTSDFVVDFKPFIFRHAVTNFDAITSVFIGSRENF